MAKQSKLVSAALGRVVEGPVSPGSAGGESPGNGSGNGHLI
jgi:hypothetical protein